MRKSVESTQGAFLFAKGSVELTHKVTTSHYHTKHAFFLGNRKLRLTAVSYRAGEKGNFSVGGERRQRRKSGGDLGKGGRRRRIETIDTTGSDFITQIASSTETVTHGIGYEKVSMILSIQRGAGPWNN